MEAMIELGVAAGLMLPAYGLFLFLKGRVGVLRSAPIFSKAIAILYVLLFAFFALLIPVATRGAAGIPIAMVAVIVGVEVGLLISLQQLWQRNFWLKRLDNTLGKRPDVEAGMRRVGGGWMINLTRSRLWRRWF